MSASGKGKDGRKKGSAPRGLPTPKDGDRRRRTTTDLVREALKRKSKTQEWTIDEGPPAGP